jgi:hypothetical protein
MMPDWKVVEPSDPEYDPSTPKWWADAYGTSDPTRTYAQGGDKPEVGPDSRPVPFWTIDLVPNSRPTTAYGSRFIAYKTSPTPANFV